MTRAESIPEALRNVPRWIVWQSRTKAPCDPRTGRVRDAHDPGTWAPFEVAVAAPDRHPDLGGIGFVLTEEDPFTGVDLDDCIGADGQPEPWARRVIDCFNSYTERSPSGTGVRIFIRAVMPPRVGHKLNGQGPAGAGAIEIYDRKRYLTVTGDVILARDVEPRQEELDAFCRMRMPRIGVDVVHGGVAELAPTGLPDDDVLRMARRAKNGTAFVKLFVHGDLADHQGDPSRGDMALVNHLAFWTGGDAAQIDRVFRGSALMRDKWDEPRGDTTYGGYTIAKVLETTKATYHATVEDGPEIVPGKPSGEPIVVRASTIPPEPIYWLWPKRVPCGFITIFAGRTGLGKSFVTLDLVSRITRGAEWPDLPGECAPTGSVLILSEDPQAQVLVPRLIAMGADLDKVWLMTWAAMMRYTLSDTETLSEAAGLSEGPVLIVIDPPTNFLGAVDEHRNAEVRAVLMKLVGWLEERTAHVGMILITHVTKAAKGIDAISRVIGSIAWMSSARIGHIFAPDPDQFGRVLFVPSKTNVGPLAEGLAYRVVETETLARVEWLGTSSKSADDAMSGEKAKPVPVEAAQWLTERFREKGQWRSEELKQAAAEAGFSGHAIFKNPRIKALPIKRKQNFTADGSSFWVWTAQGDWPNPHPIESAESAESPETVEVNPCVVKEIDTFRTPDRGAESGPAPESAPGTLSDQRDTFRPGSGIPESEDKD